MKSALQDAEAPLETGLAPAPLFTDHAVLQRGVPVPVWGTAAPGEQVSVSYAGQIANAIADSSGRWLATLDPLPDGAAGELVIKGAHDTRILNDVVAGEVWLCSGQSNMEMSLPQSMNGAAEVAAADYPQIRQFAVRSMTAPTPQPSDFLTGGWNVCAPSTALNFTAVGYYFARHISSRLNGVPVGLIRSARGATPIQPWIPMSAIGDDPLHTKWLAFKQRELADWPAQEKIFAAGDELWARQVAEARAAGKPIPEKPWTPGRPDQPQYMPANLYNAMIHPLVPYSLRGVLWYQGESNAGHGADGAADYARLQPMLMSAWRAAWNQPDLPFYFVQLPNLFRDKKIDPHGTSWAYFREAQAKVAATDPAAALAVTVDIGDDHEIHPANKHEVGRRLALLAAEHTYGQDTISSGPTLKCATPLGGEIVLSFGNIGSGLAVRDGGDRLEGFEIAGVDRNYHPAEARIVGDRVHLSCARVPLPIAARYAWGMTPQVTLFNREGLPAAPFRSDDWHEDSL